MFSLLSFADNLFIEENRRQKVACSKLGEAFLGNDPRSSKISNDRILLFLANSRAWKMSSPPPPPNQPSWSWKADIPPDLRMHSLLYCHCSSDREETLVSTAMHRIWPLRQQAAPLRQYEGSLHPYSLAVSVGRGSLKGRWGWGGVLRSYVRSGLEFH